MKGSRLAGEIVATPTARKLNTRVGIFVTHPIQYFAPIWRGLAKVPQFHIKVYFFSDHSVRGGFDSGFGVNVKWDVPLLEGYEHEFLSRQANLSRARSVRMVNKEQVFDSGGFDVVLIHGYTHGFEQQVASEARRRNIPLVMRGEFTDALPELGRGVLMGLLRDFYLRRFYANVRAFGVIGNDARTHLLRLGVSESKLYFSPYSIDSALLEEQRARFVRSKVRQDMGVMDDQVVLLFSGKLIPRKDPLLLLKAISSLPSELASRLVVIFVGDGELRASVEQDGRKILGNRLRMPGFVNQGEIGFYFAGADLFVLPSKFETWGLVLNEAMQFSLPVIASDRVGATRDLIAEGETGFVFSAGSYRGLARVIERAIVDGPWIARAGSAARKKISGYSTEASVIGLVNAVNAATGQ